MAADVRYHGKQPQERLADRLKNSGGDLPADVKTKHGDGARRTFHNIHNSGTAGGSKKQQQPRDGGNK